ncbi:MAG: response regulator, partial [Gammaproteobacteria bacterium]|nr:response regulator [Gammaproteobacteria bacterium]NIT64626.1 response regulator [Gammaproteobacteria bacterium]NIY33206.1 response regulator [Gammaproteobacteria bacterium]
DDDVVRDVLCNMLASGGYHVLTARDGLEGIAAFSTHQRQVDLVVLDMIMPGL